LRSTDTDNDNPTFALINGSSGKADMHSRASRGRTHFLPAMARQGCGTGVVFAMPTRESQPASAQSECIKCMVTVQDNMLRIRLITFDAFHTIITPRHPIHVQYSQVFAPFLGVLPPESIKQSFKKGERETPARTSSKCCSALKEVQAEHPSYDKGAKQWWSDVIRRTAIGGGGSRHGMYGKDNPSSDESNGVSALDENLSDIVETLMARFSSKEGYKAFDDAISTSQSLSAVSLI